MKTPGQPEDEAFDPNEPGVPFKNDAEYQAWLQADPRRGEALLAVARELLEKQRDGMTPEKRQEMEALFKQFGHELSGATVPTRFNALAGRLNVLLKQDAYTDEEVAELEKLEAEIKHLVDLALDMPEDERSAAIATMQHALGQIRLTLDSLERD
ncbi:MAG TPA: hypothetical protein VI454_03040 [Verrucomicrobiae bacterium]|jgi:hypothetical protein